MAACILGLIFIGGVHSETQYWWRAVVDERQVLHHGGHYTRYLDAHPTQAVYIRKGVVTAIRECQRLFRNNRWNCTSNNRFKPFGPLVRVGCRETAFVYAITSAGLVYDTVRACSAGLVYGCHNYCIKLKTLDVAGTYVLNATHLKNDQCDDKIKFGVNIWRNFVYNGEKSRDIRGRYNIHNSQLGVQEVYKSAVLMCRCHGVSGNCLLKLCSKKLPTNFESIGNEIFSKYGSAKFVVPDQRVLETTTKEKNYIEDWYKPPPPQRDNGVTTRKRRSKHREVVGLQFFDLSPDFCRKSIFSSGTKHRMCKLEVSVENYKNGERSCDDFCCFGRASRTVQKTIRKNCRFVYCCNVVCDEEQKEVQEYYCL